MSFSRKLTIDAQTIVAGVIVWFMFAGGALIFGLEFIPALFASCLVAFFLGMTFVVANARIQRFVTTPMRALILFAYGMIVALVSFGGDCIVGAMNSSGLPMIHACISKSGAGIAFTASAIVFAIGVPIIGLLRIAIAAVWRH